MFAHTSIPLSSQMLLMVKYNTLPYLFYTSYPLPLQLFHWISLILLVWNYTKYFIHVLLIYLITHYILFSFSPSFPFNIQVSLTTTCLPYSIPLLLRITSLFRNQTWLSCMFSIENILQFLQKLAKVNEKALWT